MTFNNDALKQLSQIGFMACFRGLPGQAITVLQGVSTARPDNAKVTTALAIAYMNAHRMDDAVKLFNQALQINPNDLTAKSFLGLTLKFLGKNAESERLLQEVAGAGTGHSRDFATAVMTSDVDELRGGA